MQKARKDSSQEPSEKAWHCRHLNVELPASRTERGCAASALSLPVCGFFVTAALGHTHTSTSRPVLGSLHGSHPPRTPTLVPLGRVYLGAPRAPQLSFPAAGMSSRSRGGPGLLEQVSGTLADT